MGEKQSINSNKHNDPPTPFWMLGGVLWHICQSYKIIRANLVKPTQFDEVINF